jgi:hypothetical protein
LISKHFLCSRRAGGGSCAGTRNKRWLGVWKLAQPPAWRPYRFQGLDPIFDDGRVSLKRIWIGGRYEIGSADLKFTDSTGQSLVAATARGATGVPVAPTLPLVLAGSAAMAVVRRRSR